MGNKKNPPETRPEGKQEDGINLAGLVLLALVRSYYRCGISKSGPLTITAILYPANGSRIVIRLADNHLGAEEVFLI